MSVVTVVVHHRIGSGVRARTRLRFSIPENIDPANVDDYLAALVEHTAARHQLEQFGKPERELVHALRRQVITGILHESASGPGRRLAARILAVLRLNDRQLLEQFSSPRRGGPNSG